MAVGFWRAARKIGFKGGLSQKMKEGGVEIIR